MNAYDVTGWANLFGAEVGAAAALTGLIFVAISINIRPIVENDILPGRAVESLCTLLSALVILTLGLVPGLSTAWRGVAFAVVGFVAWLVPTYQQLHLLRHPSAQWNWTSNKSWILWRAIMSQLAAVPFIVCGVSLVLGCGGGLYWLVPGIIFAFLAGMYGAWVLLIEILR